MRILNKIQVLLTLVMLTLVSSINTTHAAYFRLTLEKFEGIGGVNVSDLTGNANFPNSPTLVTHPTTFEVADNAGFGDNYGVRIWGVYQAPATGNYTFKISSDDGSELWLSSNDQPAGRVKITQQTGWNGFRQFNNASGAQALVAGQYYYLEALMKEGGGGDHVTVAVQEPGGPGVNNGDPGIAEARFVLSSRAGNVITFPAGAPSIVTQPQSQTINEGNLVTFSVVADGGVPFTYQWRSNAVDIPGATSSSFSFRTRRVANGANFSVVVNNATGPAVTSANALLTVVTDNTPPTALSARGRGNATEVVITFSEYMDLGSATEPSAYSVATFPGGVPVVVSSAALSVDGTKVTLVTAPQTRGASYRITMNDGGLAPIYDYSGFNSIASGATIDFVASSLTVTAGLAVWFDAAVGVSTSAGQLTTWEDQSGNAHTATKSNGDIQLAANQINGKPAMIFRSQGIAGLAGSLFGREQYIVLRLPGGGDWGAVLGSQDSAQYLMRGPECRFWDGRWPDQVRQNGGDPSALNTGNNFLLSNCGNYMILKIRGQNNGANPRPNWFLGKTEGWNDLNMDVAEILAYDTPLSVADDNSVGSYLAQKYAINGGYPTPLSFAQHPASQTVGNNQPFSFSVQVNGGAPELRWYTNGTLAVGQTSTNYSDFAKTGMNGWGVRAVASNSFGSVTSTIATLTVTTDLVPPTLVSAAGKAGGTSVVLTFSELMDPISAGEIANYSITKVAGGASLTVTGASVSGNKVTLTTAQQNQIGGRVYRVLVNEAGLGNVNDLSGNSIASDSTIDFSMHLMTVTSGLAVWFDAAEGVSTSGGQVTTWLDISGNGHTATKVNGNVTLASNQVNGKPAVVFRSQGIASLAGSLFGREQYIVLRLPGGGDWGAVLGNQDNAQYLIRGSECRFWEGRWPDQVRQNGSAPGALNTGNNFQLSSCGNYMILKITGQNNGANPRPNWFLGRTEGWNDFNMDVAEILAYDHPLTPGEDDVIGTYLTVKYAIGTTYPPPATQLAFTLQPQSQSRLQGQQFSFNVTNTGSPTAVYWRSNSVAAPGQNGFTYADTAQLAMNGWQFQAVISNAFGSVTSAPAILNVAVDNQAPVLVRAAPKSITTVEVTFDEAMNATQANVPGNYSITTVPGGAPLAVSAAVVSGNKVALTVASMTTGARYHLLINQGGVNPLFDLSGNPIAANSTADFIGPIDSCGVGGTLLMEIYNGVGGGNMGNFLGSAKYINHLVDETRYLSVFDTGPDFRDNYGAVVQGIIIPSQSGNYQFNYISDDNGQLFLSTDANPANDVSIAVEGGCCANIESGVIALTAGTRYHIRGVYTEGGGGDYERVSWRNNSPGSTIPNYTLITSANVEVCFVLSITQQPADVTAETGHNAIFTVVATFVTGTGTATYQWQRSTDGGATFTPIAGATSASYGHIVTSPNTGEKYRCVVGAVGSVQTMTSVAGTLTVTPDVTAPALLSAQGIKLNLVLLTFSEAMNTSETDPAAYELLGPGAVALNVISVTVSGSTVLLTTAPQTAGGIYTVTADPGGLTALHDLAGNRLPQDSMASFTATENPFGPGDCTVGSIRREFYENIGGTDIASLTNNSAYINHTPDSAGFLTEFNSPGHGDNYGVRMTGLLVPTQTGDYRFQFNSDDQGEVWLSTDETQENMTSLVREDGCCGDIESAGTRNLVAGRAYYVMCLFKEGGGGDYGLLRWRNQSGGNPAAYTIIPGANLSFCHKLLFTRQPASVTVDTSTTVILTAKATLYGVGDRAAQWQRSNNGGVSWTAIPGATGTNYSFVSAPADNGAKFRHVINLYPFNETYISSEATVTVNVDVTPPTLVSAAPNFLLNKVTVTFSESMNPLNANEVGAYTISNLAGGSITVSAAVTAGSKVTLTTQPMTPNTQYVLVVNFDNLYPVTDLAGNEVVPGSTASFTTPSQGFQVPGSLFEIYNGVGNGVMANFVASPAFVNHDPTSFRMLSTFDTGPDFADNYGGEITGFIVPSESGNYQFSFISDDNGEAFLSTDASAANAVSIAVEGGCCANIESGVKALVAGQQYYVRVLYTEGGGGDYARLSWRNNSPGSTIPGYAIIGAPNLQYPYSLTTTQNPTSQTNNPTVNPGFVANFQAAAVPGGAATVVKYQWHRSFDNGATYAPVGGATSPSYSFVPGVAGNGTKYRCEMRLAGGFQTNFSTVATLVLTGDFTPPTALSARGVKTLNGIKITFSEQVSGVSGATIANYTVTNSLGAVVPVSAAVLGLDGTTVTLSIPAHAPGAVYGVNIQNVGDSSDNLMAPTNFTFRTWTVGLGSVVFDTFMNINGDITALEGNPAFPNSPTATFHIAGLDSRRFFPDDSNDNYGARMSGYLVPPLTSNYTFYVKSDDQSKLFLSTDSSPANKVLIANEPGCCGQYADHASGSIALTGGSSYYLDAYYKEGGGGDYLQVASKFTANPTDPNTLTPVPGVYLASLADPVGAVINIVQQPLSIVFGAPATNSVLSQDFNANDGGFTVVTPLAYDGPWAYSAGTGSWIENGQDPDNGHANISMLNSPVVAVTQAGVMAVTFSHRYSMEDTWDGGQIRVSVNGGPFEDVGPAAFTANGYSGNSAYTGERVFTGTSPGHGVNTKITSTAILGSFAPGDTLQVQFIAANDSNTRGVVPNWEIDSVNIDRIVGVFAAMRVSVTTTNDYGDYGQIAYQWQKLNGVAWQDIYLANKASYLTTGPGTCVDQYRAKIYIPGANVTTAVATMSGDLVAPVIVCSTNRVVHTVIPGYDTNIPSIRVAGNLLIDLHYARGLQTMTGFPGQGADVSVTNWQNYGTAGGAFVNVQNSVYVSNVNMVTGNGGLGFHVPPRVLTLGGLDVPTSPGARLLVSTVPTPPQMYGQTAGVGNPYTIEAWVFLPASDTVSRGIFAWTENSPPGGDAGWLSYGNPGVGHNNGKDATWPTVPAAGAWRLLTATYDGATEKLYIDGAQVYSAPKNLNIVGHNPNAVVNGPNPGGVQTNYYPTLFSRIIESVPYQSSFSMNGDKGLAALRVHSAAMSGADVAANFTAGVSARNQVGNVPVTYVTSATDSCDPFPTLNCVPPSGSLFNPGTTTVNCTSYDLSLNTNTCSFSVVVIVDIPDVTPPTITCSSNRLVSAISASGTNVTYAASASDAGGLASLVCLPASGSLFPLGTTTVNCTATDNAGNTNICSFNVVVTQLISPTIVNSSYAGGVFGMSFATVNGLTYFFEYTTTLDGSVNGENIVWVPISQVAGDGTVKTVSNTPPPGTALRIYRVRIQ